MKANMCDPCLIEEKKFVLGTHIVRHSGMRIDVCFAHLASRPRTPESIAKCSLDALNAHRVLFNKAIKKAKESK